jgi:histidine triad (HIT) family protein
MNYDNNNIFAKIIRGEIPCDKVYEDDYVLAFRDIQPQKKIHILVIPKGKYISLFDFSGNASPEEITAFHHAVAKIIKDENLADNGFRAISNSGAYGAQEVPHYHLHLLGGEPVGPMVSN